MTVTIQKNKRARSRTGYKKQQMIVWMVSNRNEEGA